MTIQHDFPLSEVLWYKIGGKAKYILNVTNKEDIFRALDFIEKENIQKVFVCGTGANLLFSDDYFDGAVIRFVSERPHIERSKDTGHVTSFAGDILDDVIQYSFLHNLTGLEWAGGLPGTVGAGVRGNVGAFGGEIKDTFYQADVIKLTDNGPIVETIDKTHFAFSYRESIIKQNKNYIVLTAQFALHNASIKERENAKEVYYNNINHRRERHPLEYPNCGSFFKNIKKEEQVKKVLEVYPDLKESVEKKWYGKVAAGYLIQRFGLQGYRVGDAQISEKHALFIVNRGNAKAKDVLQIVDTIQEKFMETFGFHLEPEVEIVT